MPAKGGNPDFENIEIERAVIFMANKSGGTWKEPPAAVAAKGADRTGEEVVNLACAKCHATGERGAPKIGDSAAWTPRVAKGLATVTQAALKGHGGMPARAGMADLSDVEIKRAIEYMFNSGLVKAAAPAPVVAARRAAARLAAAPAGGKADGKKVYDTACAVCHAAGVAGAPKFGDKAAWAPRLKPGVDALYASALKGKAAMPAKGGNASLAGCRREGRGRLHGRRSEVGSSACRGPAKTGPAGPVFFRSLAGPAVSRPPQPAPWLPHRNRSRRARRRATRRAATGSPPSRRR